MKDVRAKSLNGANIGCPNPACPEPVPMDLKLRGFFHVLSVGCLGVAMEAEHCGVAALGELASEPQRLLLARRCEIASTYEDDSESPLRVGGAHLPDATAPGRRSFGGP
ncbi:MAG: hypothetical protein QOI31_2347 [Solirubrobacterales bacterium]|jgi:hypothetical protein|nr:hypothetical protein [Solirubrobacterales bacterium]